MTTDLPFIDELDTVVEAPAARAFTEAARRMGRGFEGRVGRAFSGWLGCVNRGTSFTVPPVVGQEANGFRVASVDAPRSLILEGQHRFATYRLSFFVDSMSEGRSRLRARTDADFPGFTGALYRAFVIGSGGHRIIVQRMLSSIASRAARAEGHGQVAEKVP